MNDKLQKRLAELAGMFTLLCFILSAFFVIQIFGQNRSVDAYNTITVDAEAERFVSPDMAEISFTFTEEEKTLEEAQIKVNEKVESLTDLLSGKEISEEDIKTTNYNTNPRYEYNRTCGIYGCESGERELVGYEVTQTVNVKVRDLEIVGEVIGLSGEVEASYVNGPRLTVEDEEKIKDEVRKEAISKAKDKAKDLSKELGVRLGKLVNFSDGGDYPIMFGRAETASVDFDDAYMAEEKALNIEVPTGENRIYASVTLTYRVK